MPAASNINPTAPICYIGRGNAIINVVAGTNDIGTPLFEKGSQQGAIAFKSLTLDGQAVPPIQGPILIDGGRLYAEDVTIRNFQTSSATGPLTMLDGEARLNRVRFLSNTGTFSGGISCQKGVSTSPNIVLDTVSVVVQTVVYLHQTITQSYAKRPDESDQTQKNSTERRGRNTQHHHGYGECCS
jgi:hypothetical protein